MLGWSEILVVCAVTILAFKWRSIPQIGKHARTALLNFRDGIRGEQRKIRDVTPDKEKE